jgi:acyl-CoA reductase-like NAD-dependent aldehyde dehydrogenase
VAIPAAKLGAALLLGNAVVWKPALECSGTGIALHQSLIDAGVPTSVAAVVLGGVDTAEWLIRHPDIGFVSFTGSTAGGRRVAMLCAQHLKPVQAELGGNNAAIVADECDFDQAARELAHSAFDFAGQGCTATRRLIVLSRYRTSFIEAFSRAMQQICVGDPLAPMTDVGPLISRQRQIRISEALHGAQTRGAEMISRAIDPDLVARGCWLAPTLVLGLGPGDSLVQSESFAPVAVLQTVDTLDQAIGLEDSVPQGLGACLYSPSPETQNRFMEHVRAGVLKLNQPTRGTHPDAPFVGWKESGLGPPEHGVWDQDAFTRWQAIYRSS